MYNLSESEKTASLERRFFAHIAAAQNGCIVWCGSRCNGYGVTSRGRRSLLAHRVAWELYNGKISPGLVVRHKCDNPSCVNPRHLELGNSADNSSDMVIRGRASKSNAKLTWNMVSEIRASYAANPRPFKEIASRFGIGASAIRQVVRGETWKDGGLRYAKVAELTTPAKNGAVKERLRKKFFLNIAASTNGCIEYVGAVDRGGYGQMSNGRGHTMKAHRLAWIIFKGDIPSTTLVRHKCDNRRCVNPNHLAIGTHADNSRDAFERGRTARGERQGSAKLKLESVRAIRSLRGVETYRQIADRFNVSESNISAIMRGVTWAWD